jgi:hypothetical protein
MVSMKLLYTEATSLDLNTPFTWNPCFVTCSLLMINWWVNCERNLKKLCMFLSKDYLYRNKTIFFDVLFTILPHLSYASCRCKTAISRKNGVLKSLKMSPQWYSLWQVGFTFKKDNFVTPGLFFFVYNRDGQPESEHAALPGPGRLLL